MAAHLTLTTFVFLAAFTFHTAWSQSSSTSISGAKGIKGFINPTGGCITVYREMLTNIASNTSNKTLMKTPDIAITFVRLSELNGEKQALVDKNNVSHTFTAFDKLSFKCEVQTNVTMPASSYLKADCWYCSAALSDIFSGVTFKTTTCVVQGNGTVTLGNEISNIKEGQIKLSVEMSKDWPWCDATSGCKGGEGKFLDLDVAIKLPDGVKKSNNSDTKGDNVPSRFELGSGVTVDFSTMSLLDGAWGKLVDNTPALSKVNQTNTVTVRFNRFVNTLLYDPTFEAGNVAFSQSAGSKLTAISLPALLFVTMVTAWIASYLV